MPEITLFSSDRHLTDDAVYLYVDALKIEKLSGLPDVVLDHVQECLQCKHSIQEVYNLVSEQDYSPLGPHPYLDQKKTSAGSSHRIIRRLAAAIVVGSGLVPEKTEPAPPDVIEPEVHVQEPVAPEELYEDHIIPSVIY